MNFCAKYFNGYQAFLFSLSLVDKMPKMARKLFWEWLYLFNKEKYSGICLDKYLEYANKNI